MSGPKPHKNCYVGGLAGPKPRKNRCVGGLWVPEPRKNRCFGGLRMPKPRKNRCFGGLGVQPRKNRCFGGLIVPKPRKIDVLDQHIDVVNHGEPKVNPKVTTPKSWPKTLFLNEVLAPWDLQNIGFTRFGHSETSNTSIFTRFWYSDATRTSIFTRFGPPRPPTQQFLWGFGPDTCQASVFTKSLLGDLHHIGFYRIGTRQGHEQGLKPPGPGLL